MSERFQNQYLITDLVNEVSKVIKGKDDALLIILTSLLA